MAEGSLIETPKAAETGPGSTSTKQPRLQRGSQWWSTHCLEPSQKLLMFSKVSGLSTEQLIPRSSRQASTRAAAGREGSHGPRPHFYRTVTLLFPHQTPLWTHSAVPSCSACLSHTTTVLLLLAALHSGCPVQCAWATNSVAHYQAKLTTPSKGSSFHLRATATAT